jgi:hypothetical protein
VGGIAKDESMSTSSGLLLHSTVTIDR